MLALFWSKRPEKWKADRDLLELFGDLLQRGLAIPETLAWMSVEAVVHNIRPPESQLIPLMHAILDPDNSPIKCEYSDLLQQRFNGTLRWSPKLHMHFEPKFQTIVKTLIYSSFDSNCLLYPLRGEPLYQIIVQLSGLIYAPLDMDVYSNYYPSE